MKDLIEKLQQRYGKNRDYSKLTPLQKEFLLHPKIGGERSNNGETVHIESINPDIPQVSIEDTFSYMSHRSMKTHWRYSQDRLPDYQMALDGATPKDLGDQSYLFKLEDNSQVKVKFNTFRDRA